MVLCFYGNRKRETLAREPLQKKRGLLKVLFPMDEMDVDGFIFSQKSRLEDEKSRLAARDRCDISK